MNAATQKKLVIGGGVLLLLVAAFASKKASAATLPATATAKQPNVTPGSSAPANFFAKALDNLFSSPGDLDTVTPSTNAPDASTEAPPSILDSITDAINKVFTPAPESPPAAIVPDTTPAPSLLTPHTNVDASAEPNPTPGVYSGLTSPLTVADPNATLTLVGGNAPNSFGVPSGQAIAGQLAALATPAPTPENPTPTPVSPDVYAAPALNLQLLYYAMKGAVPHG